MKIIKAIWSYLKDWKNWLVHALVGIGLLVMLIWVPVQWWVKGIVLLCVILFNSARMIIAKKRKNDKKMEE